MHLYRMGPPAGPHRIGVTRDAPGLFERQNTHLPPGSTFWFCDAETGAAGMALARLRTMDAVKGDWLYTDADRATNVVMEAAGLVADAITHAHNLPALDKALMGRVMHYIRTEIFGTTQDMIGTLLSRSESLVSRWESGDVIPGLDEIMRLRSVAVALGLGWDDRILLDPATYLASRAEQEN